MDATTSPDTRPRTIADLPAQQADNPGSPAEARARYFNSGNAFNIQLPDVPNAVFTEEPTQAMDAASPTGFYACDTSDEMACAFPATTPLVLARYARIGAGEEITATFNATGVVCYVISGHGRTEIGKETLNWNTGDVFLLPGGRTTVHYATDEPAVLWLVTNEPLLQFENLQAPAEGQEQTDIVHYPAAEITRQIDLLYDIGQDTDTAGSALIFSADKQQASRNILPTLTLAMNSLPPGAMQRPHRHNSVAVSLVVRGDRCYSMIDGQRKDWAPWATTITPPVSVHSHHNDGAERALFLIVQDGGLYYHARAMGFQFVDD